jgi:hypothetical protein
VERFRRVAGFPRHYPMIHERISRGHADQRLVFDYQHFFGKILRHPVQTPGE